MAKKPEETEEEKRPVLMRAVPVEDMFNEISDKLTALMVEILDLKKIASEE